MLSSVHSEWQLSTCILEICQHIKMKSMKSSVWNRTKCGVKNNFHGTISSGLISVAVQLLKKKKANYSVSHYAMFDKRWSAGLEWYSED